LEAILRRVGLSAWARLLTEDTRHWKSA
jgi:hypothetical protein